MIKIVLSESDSKYVDAVRALARHVESREPNFNGADIAVAVGEYTYVDGSEELSGAELLARVRGVIDNN